MTTAQPPAPSASSAQILFLSRLRALQPRPLAGRVSNWPFRVAVAGTGNAASVPPFAAPAGNSEILEQAARVLRTTADSWWPQS